MNHLSKIDNFLNKINKLNVLVIGDVMLDKYIWGDIKRISQEAPIPIIDVNSISHNIGGAGNVASNLVGLGSKVSIASITGIDKESEIISNILKKNNIDDSMVFHLSNRKTTLKTRYLSKSQQVFRVDSEDSSPLIFEEKIKFFETIKSNIDKYNGIIIQSYDKGLIDIWFIKELLKLCKKKQIPIYVDPKRKNFFDFLEVKLFKPNLNEVSNAFNINVNKNNIEKIGLELRKKIKCSVLLITQGSEGMSLFDENGFHQIPTKAQSVHDVSGAGDTVISVFILANLCGIDNKFATELSNFAAGKVCEHIGVYSIKKEDFKSF